MHAVKDFIEGHEIRNVLCVENADHGARLRIRFVDGAIIDMTWNVYKMARMWLTGYLFRSAVITYVPLGECVADEESDD